MKIKGLVFTPRNGQGWPYTWITNFEWDAWMKPQIDLAVEVGANAMKFCPDITVYRSGGANKATMRSRFAQCMEYLDSVGLQAAWMVPVQDWGAQAGDSTWIDAIQEFVVDLEQYPNVLHFDCLNECNYHMTATDSGIVLGILVPAIREVSSIPVTASIAGLPQNTVAFQDAVAPWVDFHDFHFYHYYLTDSQLRDYFLRPYGFAKRAVMVGEIGITGVGTLPPDADLVTQLEGAAPILAAGDVHGTFLFPIPDYTGPGGDGYPGMAGQDLVIKASVRAAFEGLPGVL